MTFIKKYIIIDMKVVKKGMRLNHKRIILSTIITIMFFLLILGLYLNFRGDELKFKDQYSLYNITPYSNGKTIKVDIPTKNNVKYVKNSDFINLISKETGIFYFGYPSCPWCRNVVETVVEVGVENNLPIYYIDIEKLDDESLKNTISYLNKYLRKTPTDELRLYVPDVYFVKKGTIINHHIGSIESQKNPYNKLKGKEKEKLKEIYLGFVEEMRKK